MTENKSILHKVKGTRIIIPVLIGLAFASYMLYKEYSPTAFQNINFTKYGILWLVLALIAMLMRDFGYIVRLRILSSNRISWIESFKIIMLWEFTSTITPSAVGGTSIAILFVNKGGLSVGESTSVVIATSLLDELYFIIMFPLLLVFINWSKLFGYDLSLSNIWENEFFYFAIIGYLVKLVYLLSLSYGLFKNPRGLKWLILQVFKLPFLRKWKRGAAKAGDDIIKSSHELIHKPLKFWIKAFAATFFSWTARYWVVNVMLLAFFKISDHLVIFARQLIMWIMMLVSPTPGGSGFAEYIFTRYLSDFIPVNSQSIGMVAIAMAFLWRLISYYPYMFIGIIILPKWIKKHFTK